MTVVLQPIGSRSGPTHYARTIISPLQLVDIQPYLRPEESTQLRTIYGDRPVPIWGVAQGQSDWSVRQWERLQVGDSVLFVGEQGVERRANVTYKAHNGNLAMYLWPPQPGERPWEYVFFLDDVESESIGYAELRTAMGYADNWYVYRIQLTNDMQESQILKYLSTSLPTESLQWELKPGDQVLRTELHGRYGGAGQGGIEPSAKTPNVLIFSDSIAGEKYGYIYDGWRDGVFHYTGDGQVGDQLTKDGNRAMLDHAKRGRALRLFEGVRGTVTYIGEFELADDPFYYAEAWDRPHESIRQVIVFRLVPVDASSPRTNGGPEPVVPAQSSTVTETVLEQHKTDAMHIEPQAGGWEAVRREQPLVHDLQRYLERKKHQVVRLRYLPEGETEAMVCDVYDKTANVLYEAKGSATRNAIRMAIGQLADYARFGSTGMQKAVLLLERPRPDLERLLRSEGIIAVWRTADGFDHNGGGEVLI